MNVLETFYILFKGDTSDLKKGQKEAEKSTDALQEKIKRTNADTLDLGVSFLELAQKAAAALGIVVGVGAAVKSAFASDAYTLNIARVGKAIGANTQDLEVWDRAFKNVAGEGATVIPVVQKLTAELNRLKNFGGGAIGQNPMSPFLTNLNIQGVKPGKDAFETLINEAERIDQFKEQLRLQGKTDAEIQQAAFAFSTDTLGNDLQTTMLLTQGKRALLEQLIKIRQQGVPTDEELERILKFATNWGKVKQAVIDLGVAITGPFLGAISAVLDPTDEMKQNLQELGVAIAIVAGIVTAIFIPALAFAAGWVLAATWPLLAVIAAIAALWAIIHYGIKLLYLLGDAAQFVFKKMKDWGSDIVAVFKDLFGWISKVIKAAEDYNPFKSHKKKEGAGTLDQQSQQDLILKSVMAITAASNNPISSQTNGSVGNVSKLNSSVIKIDEINVQTQATDADGIAASIDNGMRNHFSRTIMQYADGVAG